MKTSTTVAAAAMLAGAAVSLMLAGGTPLAAGHEKAEAAKGMGEMKHEMHHGALQERIAGAKTSHDHVMLADEFEAEANRLEKKAAEHESMGKSYAAFPGKSSGQSMAIHCRSIAKNYREAAMENRELAKFHREQSQRPD